MPLGKINKRLSSLLALSMNIFLKFKCPIPFKSYEFYLLNYLKNKAFKHGDSSLFYKTG